MTEEELRKIREKFAAQFNTQFTQDAANAFRNAQKQQQHSQNYGSNRGYQQQSSQHNYRYNAQIQRQKNAKFLLEQRAEDPNNFSKVIYEIHKRTRMSVTLIQTKIKQLAEFGYAT